MADDAATPSECARFLKVCGGDQAAAGTSRSAPAMVLDALLHPACSIAVAVGLGFHYQQLVLCLCCSQQASLGSN